MNIKVAQKGQPRRGKGAVEAKFSLFLDPGLFALRLWSFCSLLLSFVEQGGYHRGLLRMNTYLVTG